MLFPRFSWYPRVLHDFLGCALYFLGFAWYFKGVHCISSVPHRVPAVSLNPLPHCLTPALPTHPDAQVRVLELIDESPAGSFLLSNVQPRLRLDLPTLGFGKLKELINSDDFPDVELRDGDGPGQEYLTRVRGGGDHPNHDRAHGGLA